MAFSILSLLLVIPKTADIIHIIPPVLSHRASALREPLLPTVYGRNEFALRNSPLRFELTPHSGGSLVLAGKLA
jgi:hypothetical protein